MAGLTIPSVEAEDNLGFQDQLGLEERGVLMSPLLAQHAWLPGRDPRARLLASPTPNLGLAAGFALELPGSSIQDLQVAAPNSWSSSKLSQFTAGVSLPVSKKLLFL